MVGQLRRCKNKKPEKHGQVREQGSSKGLPSAPAPSSSLPSHPRRSLVAGRAMCPPQPSWRNRGPGLCILCRFGCGQRHTRRKSSTRLGLEPVAGRGGPGGCRSSWRPLACNAAIRPCAALFNITALIPPPPAPPAMPFPASLAYSLPLLSPCVLCLLGLSSHSPTRQQDGPE